MKQEDLLAQLNCRTATGMRGEQATLMYEITRLRRCHCPEPERYVKHTALDNVSAGYDIESIWPSQKRFIKMKATRVARADFFLSANECEVLKTKGRVLGYAG